jgi:large repetitive protein
MVNSRKPVFGSMKSQMSKKTKSKKLAKRTRQFEMLERREMMTSGFSSQVNAILATMLFRDTASYQATGQILQARLGGGGGGSSSGSGAAGEADAPFNTVEAEPNNSRTTANFLPLGNAPGQNPVVNVSGIAQSILDEDYFAFDLKKGDILDVRAVTGSITASGPTSLALLNPQGTELLYSNRPFYPPITSRLSAKASSSPRFNDGAATLSYIIDTDGRYYLRMSDTVSGYSLNFRTYRPTIEQEPIGTKQIIFLDFDGAFVRNDLISLDLVAGVPAQTVRVAPFDRVLPSLGLTTADAPSIIRNIQSRVERTLRTQLARDTNNGLYSESGQAGDFDIQIVTSLDGDFWGQKNVSRILVGGSRTDFGLPATSGLLGISQSIDIGNFDREDTALVMTDLLALIAPTIPRAGNVPLSDAFAEALSLVISHEAGHYLGAMHQDPDSPINTVMDAFYDPARILGFDGLFGTPDDTYQRFINDDYRPLETRFGGGVNNSGQILAFGLSTGKVGGSIIGTVFNDLNRNAAQGSGEAGLANWEVFADLNSDGVRQAGEPRTVTDGSGKYNLQVAAGTYNVRVTRPGSWIASTNSEIVKTVSVVAGATTQANFGSVLPSDTITGFKWNDLNGDGIRDAGEPGLGGVYIYLDLDGDQRPDLGEPASITKADGTYVLTPPTAGTYNIREVVDPGYVQTFPGEASTFQHTVVYNGSTPLRGFNFGNFEQSDWGDAPAPYPTTRAQNGASHGFAAGLRIGANWDPETDGQPSANATGDNAIGLLGTDGRVVNDEDGIIVLTPIVRGDRSNLIQATITNTTGTSAFLQGWIDFNGNGVWEASEQIATDIPAVNGVSNITFTTPTNAVSNTFARFRLSQDRGLQPTGRSTTGEVEDYAISIVNGPRTLLQPDEVTVARNSLLNPIDVLANDFQIPNDPWRITSVSAGSQGGRISIDPTGRSLIYSPATSFVGTEEFTYTTTSASGRVETTRVTARVILQFNDPLAVDDSFDVPTNSVGFPLSVLANDVEGRGGALIVTNITTPDKGGAVTIGSGGQSIRYTPRRGFGGTESFSYTVTDATGKTSTAKITVHTTTGDSLDDVVEFSFAFLNPAGEPIAQVKQGDQFQVVVFVDDLRPELGALETPPRTISSPGVYSAYLDILYSAGLVTPNAPNGTGFDFSTTFQAPYLSGNSGTAATPGLIDEYGGFVGNVSSFNRPFRTAVGVINFTASSAGIADFAGDPADRFPDSEVTFYNTPSTRVPIEQIRYKRATLEIAPSGTNFPFAVDDTRFSLIAATQYNIDVLRNDISGNQPPIQIKSVTQPANGQTVVNNNNTPSNFADDTVTYVSNTNFVGTDQFTYTITDNRGFISTATVTVHVGNETGDDIVQLRLSATDLSGVPIDQIQVGQQFQLRGYVEDLRTVSARFGVFAAFQDVLYDSGLITVNTSAVTTDNPLGFQVAFADQYSNGKSGDIRIPGLINELGSVQADSANPTGRGEKLQFTITLTAKAVGTANFLGDPADVKPFHDSFVFDPTTPLTPNQIRYLSDSIVIVGAGGGGTGGGEGNTNLSNAYDVNNDGFVSPIDVLILVNSMNTGGSGALIGGSGGGSGENNGNKYYLDVNADKFLSPLDALLVINFLNTRSAGSGSSAGGEGEGEGSAPAVSINNKQSGNVLVEVPFLKKKLVSNDDMFYGPLPANSDLDKVMSIANYMSTQDSSDDMDFLDGLASDVFHNA